MPKYNINPDFMTIDKWFKMDFSKPYIVKALNLLFKLTFRYGSSKKGIVIAEKIIKGYKSEDLRLVTYKPVDIQPFAPCIIYSHGGGFFLNGSYMSRKAAIHYARTLSALVVYVDYHSSLTHPFPAALEEVYAALCWADEQAEALGIDKKRVAVAGESAGGALSATVSQLSRDRKGPNICCQLLIYPVLDDKMETATMKAFTDTPLWDTTTNQVMWDYYLRGIDREKTPYISAMRSSSFQDLPPAYIETAEFDPLRDEGVVYAQKLEKEGVIVELNDTKNTLHGYDIDYTHNYVKAQVARRISFFRKYFYPTNHE